MIVWPDDKLLRSAGREALRRFRETSAAAELESSTETWRVVAWPWTSEPPYRIALENDALRAVDVTLGESGTWLISEQQREMRLRSPESLERDARGIPTPEAG